MPDHFAATHQITPSQARLLKSTAEHLFARSNGGTDMPDNIVAACVYCNMTRHKRKVPMEPDQYRKHVRARLAKDAWHRVRIIAVD